MFGALQHVGAWMRGIGPGWAGSNPDVHDLFAPHFAGHTNNKGGEPCSHCGANQDPEARTAPEYSLTRYPGTRCGNLTVYRWSGF